MALSFFSATTILPLFLMTALLMVNLYAMQAAARDSLKSGQWLKSGESLENAGYSFTLRKKCNIIISDSNNKIIWGALANYLGYGCNLKLQHDGNLVMYNRTDAVWSSRSNQNNWKIYHLILQVDHNVVINDDANNTIWETKTSSSP